MTKFTETLITLTNATKFCVQTLTAKGYITPAEIRAFFAADFAGASHAASHATGGADPVSPASIGAAEALHFHSQYLLTSKGATKATKTGNVLESDEIFPSDIMILAEGFLDAYFTLPSFVGSGGPFFIRNKHTSGIEVRESNEITVVTTLPAKSNAVFWSDGIRWRYNIFRQANGTIALTDDMTGHLAAIDPHGDRAYMDSELADHVSDTDPHGDRAYADTLVTGLLDDRGNFDASVNLFPTTGGSGPGGAILKGDLWTISVVATSGPLEGYGVSCVLRALVDAPGQTVGNWAINAVGYGYAPENVANKSSDVAADFESLVKYPTVKAIVDWVQAIRSWAGLHVFSGAISLGGTPTKKLSIWRNGAEINTELNFIAQSGVPVAGIGVDGVTTNDLLINSLGSIRFYTNTNDNPGSFPTNETLRLKTTREAVFQGNITLEPQGVANSTISFGIGYGAPALLLFDGGAGVRYGWGLNADEMQFFMPSGSPRRFTWNIGGDLQPTGDNELMRLTEAGVLGLAGGTWNGTTFTGPQEFSSTTRPTTPNVTGTPAIDSVVNLGDCKLYSPHFYSGINPPSASVGYMPLGFGRFDADATVGWGSNDVPGFFVPYCINAPFNKISVNHKTGTHPTAVYEIAIYLPDANGKPHTLVEQGSVTLTATGRKTVTLSQSYQIAGLFFVCMRPSIGAVEWNATGGAGSLGIMGVFTGTNSLSNHLFGSVNPTNFDYYQGSLAPFYKSYTHPFPATLPAYGGELYLEQAAAGPVAIPVIHA